MKYKFSMNMKQSRNSKLKKRILLNTLNGKNVKITDECFDVLMILINNKMERSDFIDALHEDDRDYFLQLIDMLVEHEILVDIDKHEEYAIDSIAIELTNRCNLNCKHCCMNAANSASEEYLSTDQMKKILEKVASLNPGNIVLTGGEPLLRKDFWDLVSYLKTKSKAPLILMTNGTLINEENVKQLTETFSQMDISIDGVNEETCSQIRGKGVFGRVLHSIELLKAEGYEKISLSMIDSEITHKYIKDFKEMCKNLNVYSMVRAFDPVGRGADNKELLNNKSQKKWTQEERIALVKSLDGKGSFRTKGFACTAGKKKFSINYKGGLYPCGPLEAEEFQLLSVPKVDNLREELNTLAYMNASGYKCFQELMPFHNECKDCEYNLFCWECLHDLYLAKKDPEYFKNRCELKKIEYSYIWE